MNDKFRVYAESYSISNTPYKIERHKLILGMQRMYQDATGNNIHHYELFSTKPSKRIKKPVEQTIFDSIEDANLAIDKYESHHMGNSRIKVEFFVEVLRNGVWILYNQELNKVIDRLKHHESRT